MKRRIHQNSLEAFDTIEDERGERAEMIYQLLAKSGAALTDRQIMTELRFHEPNAVRPRITELIDNRWLVETSSVVCPVTGKHVRRVRALNEQARNELIACQRALWEAQRRQPELSLSFA